MSTRAVIAKRIGPRTWQGRYHHFDGYPEGLGAELYKLYHGHFKRNVQEMLTFLIDAHPAGWSSILGADFNLPAGYSEMRDNRYQKAADGSPDYTKPIPHGPACFCHGDRTEQGWLVTNRQGPDDREWAYIINPADSTMEILRRVSRPAAFEGEDWEERLTWRAAATVKLDDPAPDWLRITCGDHLEYCHHYAYYHFPELAGTPMARLSTDKFLGKEPLHPEHDAYAYVYKGVTYRTGDSGTAATDAKGRNLWLVSVTGDSPAVPKFRNITRHSGWSSDGYLPVVIRADRRAGTKQRMYPGVKPLYPPTLKNPLDVLAAIRAKTLQQPQLEVGNLSAAATEPGSELLAMIQTGRKFRNESEA